MTAMRNPIAEVRTSGIRLKSFGPFCLAILGLLAGTELLPAKDFEAVMGNIMMRPEYQKLEGPRMAEYLAKEIRKDYRNDEAAIIADALRFGEGRELEGPDITVLTFFSALDLSPASRLSLVEKMVTGASEREKGGAYMLLKFSDRKADKKGGINVDLSGHLKLINDGTDLPAEYFFYLFKQDGPQAWKLLRGSPEKSPALAGLETIDMSAGSRSAIRQWVDKIRPGLEGKNFPTTNRDACYLARYLGTIYGDEETARRNNPEIMKQLDQAIPGLGVALVEMGESMEHVPKTPPAEAAAWVERTHGRLKLQGP